MFTGIVAELGVVVEVERGPQAARLTVEGEVVHEVAAGDSVAVDGVCLTATRVAAGRFTSDVMQETLLRSTLGDLAAGARVNLELAATPTTRLGGHLVQGHVDGLGIVTARRSSPRWDEVDVALPVELMRYVVMKGSVSLDGVSLTVARLRDDGLTVSLIPETLRRTTLGLRQPGDRVNVEVDVLAKHIERLLAVNTERLLAVNTERRVGDGQDSG